MTEALVLRKRCEDAIRPYVWTPGQQQEQAVAAIFALLAEEAAGCADVLPLPETATSTVYRDGWNDGFRSSLRMFSALLAPSGEGQ